MVTGFSHDTVFVNVMFSTEIVSPFKALCFQLKYRNDPKFSDRYAWANSADPDQMLLEE